MENTDKGIIFNVKRFSVHDGPGIRTSIFLKGCPLNCIWCHNPEGIDPGVTIWYNSSSCIACGRCVISCPEEALKLRNGTGGKYVEINRTLCRVSGNCVKECPTGAMQFTGVEITVDELMVEIRKDMVFYQTSGGGITLTGGEPLYQEEFSTGILKACKNENISTAIETSLYCERGTLENFFGLTHLFIVDIKIFDSVLHQKYTGKTNSIILENIRFLADNKINLALRVPVIPGITDSDPNLAKINEFVSDLKLPCPIEYLPYNLLTENKYKKLNIPFLMDQFPV
jgi:pyruvate formate lyase activating enzyme